MAHESGLTQSDKCPHEWNKWPGDFGLPSINKSENGTKAARAFTYLRYGTYGTVVGRYLRYQLVLR